MKKHIVRAPQTDRLLISIPTALTDLTDYTAPTPAYGAGTADAPHTVEAAGAANLSMSTFTDLVGTTGTTVLTLSVAGLFLCIGTFVQAWVVPGIDLRRRVGFSVNGAAAFTKSLLCAGDHSGNAVDNQCTFFIRLAVGDTIQPRFQNLTGGAVNVTASLSILRVAP